MAISKAEKWLTEDGLTLLECWARDGLTDAQIMNNMGIKSTSTFYGYKKRYPKISNALKKGKEIVDYEVENSLLKRAKGFEYTEVTKETKWNPSLEKFELIVSKEITKYVVPDTTAQIYWLKNRKPKKWRDKIDIDNTDVDNINKGIINIAELINNPQKVRNEEDFNE